MDARTAKAEAKAAKARAKALRPWWKKKRVWLSAGVVVLVIAIAASASGSGDKNAAGVSTGLATKDAAGDVTKLAMQGPDALGYRRVEVSVTNHSSKRSDYLIELSIESVDGATRIDSTTVFVTNLEPGQSTTENGLVSVKDVPAGAVAKVKTVSRHASP
jgi:hypothetical protein